MEIFQNPLFVFMVIFIVVAIVLHAAANLAQYAIEYDNIVERQILLNQFVSDYQNRPSSSTMAEINELKSLLRLYREDENGLTTLEYDRLCQLIGLEKYYLPVNQITAE